MKKIVLMLVIFAFTLQTNAAITFEEAAAENAQKPMAVFVYAKWAKNYDSTLDVFKRVQNTLGNSYNYVEVDLASENAKEYTERYSIMPQLPYIMLYRGKGKFQRILDRDCAADISCVATRMKSFLR